MTWFEYSKDDCLNMILVAAGRMYIGYTTPQSLTHIFARSISIIQRKWLEMEQELQACSGKTDRQIITEFEARFGWCRSSNLVESKAGITREMMLASLEKFGNSKLGEDDL